MLLFSVHANSPVLDYHVLVGVLRLQNHSAGASTRYLHHCSFFVIKFHLLHLDAVFFKLFLSLNFFADFGGPLLPSIFDESAKLLDGGIQDRFIDVHCQSVPSCLSILNFRIASPEG
jgi:hypothetical protein